METLESIVHEFTILYSNRIHQKDKKWNDGRLKYYEFNGKIEILNDDDNIISTDFVQTKNHKQVLATKLAVNNQFKLTNNKLVIEVTDQGATYTRDITNSFKKKTPMSLSEIKYEEVTPIKREYKTPLTPTSGDTLNRQVKRRHVGLRKVKPKIKSDPETGTRDLDFKIKSPQVKVKIEHEEPLFQSPPHSIISKNSSYQHLLKNISSDKSSRNPSPISTPKTIPLTGSTVTTRTPPKRIPRISPGSSKHFQYLNHKSINQSREDYTDSLAQGNLQVIKAEPESFESKKSLEEADIIYDLSDFEEDEKFLKMLKEMQNERDIRGVNFGNDMQGTQEEMIQFSKENVPVSTVDETLSTPSKAQGPIQSRNTPASNKKCNESHDFDLSSSSEFEDVDSTPIG
ncbi:uncharacterized protein CANTADRAFT_48906 [Suhomyces tanzawaensis NRRL Y-17324]|uniref:5'-3' DNA helicase ZGRF1-like N-terminal domain-containing protein n=1 Tax=Suhomyces tanzawaensis NRRL Y-17324 TaxID=984487 RepID=A0A1E4SL18_9ASCO|nr:uncharacterized protein CANTADRAFT_48906 [Suhomyces tanzawaensis NRRL Y-17324]ODV80137.1 hypothetical protein CANTADRAFT_48906 [Suhomyces tanzawaensis NRRL Y-17324]